MGKWFAFPTWFLTYIVPLPKTHPWHDKTFTLQDWYEHQTDLCREFDFGFWIIGVGIVCVAPMLIYRLWV